MILDGKILISHFSHFLLITKAKNFIDSALLSIVNCFYKFCCSHYFGGLLQVAKPGSVKVEKLMTIERYSHVMHISSTVRICFSIDIAFLTNICCSKNFSSVLLLNLYPYHSFISKHHCFFFFFLLLICHILW